MRLASLRRFAIAISVLNLLGHTVLGFEQAWVHPLAALATTYGLDLLVETLDARAERRRPRYAGSVRALVDFLLPAHISGLAVAMLLYPGDRIGPVVFAAAVAMGSKVLLRVRTGRGTRHVMNPSNFGITITLLLFPSVGIAPPYQFTENLGTVGDWLIVAVIVTSGSLLNGRLTGRLPLVAAWVGGFILQAVVRAVVADASFVAALGPLTGVAVVLYALYMITDPATTPESTQAQVAFGVSAAAVYGALMMAHVVFGLFFALTIVCAVRGAYLLVTSLLVTSTDLARLPAPMPLPMDLVSSQVRVHRGPLS